MSQPNLDALYDDVEGLVYGRLIDAGVDKTRANHVSTRAAVRVRDMVRDAA